jgi:autotransporter-associated beta strand protein
MGNGGATGFLNAQNAFVSENTLLKFNLSSDKTFAAAISSYADGAIVTGAVEKAGNGKLTLTKDWHHGGGVTLSRGTLQLGSGSSAEGKIVRSDINISNANAKLIINFNEDYDLNFPGWTNQGTVWVFPPKQCIITGVGSVEKTGSGALKALGNNTCTGQFTHSAGKLHINKWAGKYVQNSGATLAAPATQSANIELASMQLNGGGYLESSINRSSIPILNSHIVVGGAFSATGNTTIIPTITGTTGAEQFALIEAGSGLNNTAYFTLNLPAYPQATLTAENNKLLLSLTSVAADRESPTASNRNITVGAITATTVQISWTKATDNVTPQNQIKYIVSCTQGTSVISISEAMTDVSTYTITNLNPDNEYTLNVFAMDEANNILDYTPIVARTSGNTGIESIETAGIKIWVENYELRIANYENAGNDLVAIYSTTGQLIAKSKLSNSNSINISNIPNGVYIVRIGNYTGKFVKK